MFYVIANNLGLDLVNTRIVDNGVPIDLLNSFDDLVEWSVAVGLLDKTKAAATRLNWSGTRDAKAVFKNALILRDSLKTMAEDLACGDAISKGTLIELNNVLRQKSGFFEVRPVSDGYEKEFHSEIGDIGGLLVPVAESAANLLCYADLAQVKKCENETCVLHFYDTSKNHRRRWCSMTACGNRAKAKAFYDRGKLKYVA